MRSLLLVLIYQISSGSGSFLAASIIPARHGKAVRLPWVSSRLPSPLAAYMSWQTFPLESSHQQALGTFSAGLSSGDFSPQPQEMRESA